MSRDPFDRQVAQLRAGITRLLWTWALGTVWLTALITGAVVLRLWGVCAEGCGMTDSAMPERPTRSTHPERSTKPGATPACLPC